MNALIIIDKDKKTELSEDMKVKLCKIFNDKGYQTETVELSKKEVFPCLGCFKCINGDIKAGNIESKDGYLIRPVIPESILAMIKRHFEKKMHMMDENNYTS